MKQSPWIWYSIIGVVVILLFGTIMQVLSFNNGMISLQEMKKAELETTKVEYGQCIIKILETNRVAKAYVSDVMALASKAGSTLQEFNTSLLALIGTQVIPQMSPALRGNVQREIISCRNAYVGRVDLSLKPLYVNFNRMQRQFPNSLYNALFFHWQTDELQMPKADAGNEIFNKGKIEPLKLED